MARIQTKLHRILQARRAKTGPPSLLQAPLPAVQLHPARWANCKAMQALEPAAINSSNRAAAAARGGDPARVVVQAVVAAVLRIAEVQRSAAVAFHLAKWLLVITVRPL